MALSTNWFRSGVLYFSSNDGIDGGGNDGSEALPYKTIDSNLIAGDNVLRSGIYTPAVTTLDILSKNLLGDSENVYIYGSTLTDIVASSATPSSTTVDYVNINGVDRIFETNLNNQASHIFKNCNIRNASVLGVQSLGVDRISRNLFKSITRIRLNITAQGDQNKFSNNTFINCGIQGENTDAGEYVRCYFENCNFSESPTDQVSETITFQDCVFDSNCTFFGENVSDIFSLLSAGLAGNKSPDASTIESDNTGVTKGTFTYSFTTPVGGRARLVYFNNCFWINKTNTNPFNGDAIEDYTLTTTAGGVQSILYNNGYPIGKYGLAYKVPINENTFPPSTRTNVDLTGGNLVLTSSSGVAQSAAIGSGNEIELPFNTLLTDAIRFFGSVYSFPNTPVDFTTTSGKVVDYLPYNTNSDNVRYTFWLKYKDPDTGNIMPVKADEDDSNAANWYEIEQGNILGVEADTSNGKGNGDIDVTIGSLTPIRAKVFQIRLVLRNNAD